MINLKGDSTDSDVPAISGKHSGNGTGVEGKSETGPGIFGQSSGTGVWGASQTWMGVYGRSDSITGGAGVMGEATGPGVIGVSKSWHGLYGETQSSTGSAGAWGEHKADGIGVVGEGSAGNGGWFESGQGEGVRGTANNPNHGGVVGVNTAGGIAVFGTSDNHVGVWGTSVNQEGVHAETHSATTAALAAYQQNPDSNGAALYAKHAGNRLAAFFEGNVFVTGDLANADCAEDFTVTESDSLVEPGTVMVLDEESRVRTSFRPYDKRAAGVVSGAGSYTPGLVLDKQVDQRNRRPIALLGKVFCEVDAQFGAIEIGDLLTISATLGHAMRATEPLRAFGAVIGKALRPRAAGQGLIPILIALH